MEKYIPLDALVAEIDRHIEFLKPFLGAYAGQIVAKLSVLAELKNFLNTLEVKEVDFDAEWKRYFEHRGEMATVNVKHLAKHFFELGLKTAQKGE